MSLHAYNTPANVDSTAPGEAPAPSRRLVLGSSLAAVAALAASDRLRLAAGGAA